MNTEQVVEMIDAISEGKPYQLAPSVDASSVDDLLVRFQPDGITFTELSNQFEALITDPRVAREIAGALVAWANQKQGGNVDLATVVKLFGDGRPEFPSVNDWADIKCGRQTAKYWYLRNVRNMSVESLNRNLESIKDNQKNISGGSILWDDLVDAIDVIKAEIKFREDNV